MKNAIFLIIGTVFLLSVMALSSFASAAPPAAPTPTPTVEVDAANLDVVQPAAPINPGTMASRILVYNPDTTGTATVSIRILNPGGTAIYTFPNFTVAVDGAVVKTLPSSITSPFSGSAMISSDKNIQAFVTDANSNNGARDEYGGTLLPAATLSLPLVRHLAPSTQNSIIAVQNTGVTATNITLNLYDTNGNLLTGLPGTTASNVPPQSSAYFNTGTIFPSGQFTGTGEVTADGTIAVAASEQTRYQKDTASFRALGASDQGTTLYVNFAEHTTTAAGAPINWNELYVRNEGSSPTTITAQYFTTIGVSKYTTTTVSSIPPKGMAPFIDSLPAFKTPLGTAFKGWVKLTSGSGQPLSAYSLEYWKGTRMFGMEAVPSTQAGTMEVCGDVLKTTTQISKINILNTGGASASVTIKVYSPTTTKSVGTKTVTIAPNNVYSFASSVFSGAGSSFEGIAIVTSTGPQIVTSVYTPYVNSGVPGGVTSFECAKLQ
ncbi:MAG: hypothetical protein WCF84_10995 [Anaerolineae bacterium]